MTVLVLTTGAAIELAVDVFGVLVLAAVFGEIGADAACNVPATNPPATSMKINVFCFTV